MLKPAFETSSLVPANRPRERRRAGRREAALRKHRIFARLAEGRSHAAIAREENCSLQWIRRIIAEALQAREADPFEEFRKLQVARLSLALQVGHQALMDGRLAAIDPYLKTVKALDRYHGSKNGADAGWGMRASPEMADCAGRKLDLRLKRAFFFSESFCRVGCSCSR